MNKVCLLGIIVISFLFLKCSKSSNSSGSTNKGNYITINGDKRDLGIIPNSDVTIDNGAWSNPDEWQLAIAVKTGCNKIAGLNSGRLEIYINIWDKSLLKTEYDLVPGYSGGGSTGGPKGKATIGIRPFKSGGTGGLNFFDAMSGKITITKNSTGALTSVTLTDIPLSTYNSQSYKISARFEVK
jgi:hypothetical protein